MKKTNLLCLAAALSLFCCGCRQEESQAPNETANIETETSELPEAIVANMQDNPYLDITGLSYVGKKTQNIAIGYEFENPVDNNPVLTYDKYRSPSGEIFCFDENGRLCEYKKRDIYGIQPDTQDATAATTYQTPATTYTTDQLLDRCEAIGESLTDSDAALDVSVYGDSSYDYLVTNRENVPSDEAPFTAIVEMDNAGVIYSIAASHNTITADVDLNYFLDKLEDYVDEARQTWDIASYTYEARYQQIDNKIYAMYVVSFVETSGAEFCECPAFTMTIPDTEDDATIS